MTFAVKNFLMFGIMTGQLADMRSGDMNMLRQICSLMAFVFLAIALPILTVAVPAQADEKKMFDELRFEQSVYWDEGAHPEPGSFSKAMVFFDPLDSEHGSGIKDMILRPRVHVGATVSLGQGTSQVFTGLDWTFDIGDRLFFDVGAGGTIHNGNLETSFQGGPKLGSRILFWHYYALGLKMNKNWSLIASWDHSSHADLCSGCSNNGLTHIGLSLGYKF